MSKKKKDQSPLKGVSKSLYEASRLTDKLYGSNSLLKSFTKTQRMMDGFSKKGGALDKILESQQQRDKLLHKDSAFSKYIDSKEFKVIDGSLDNISRALQTYERLTQGSNAIQILGEHNESLFKLCENLQKLNEVKAKGVPESKIFEWIDGEITDVESDNLECHPDYEIIKKGNCPQLSIRDLAILKHPVCENKRIEFQAMLILLVRSGLLKSKGAFVDKSDPENHVIAKEDYLNCEQLVADTEYVVNEWLELSKPSEDRFIFDPEKNKNENRASAFHCYLKENELEEDYTPEVSLRALWTSLFDKKYLDNKRRNIFAMISDHEINRFFRKHTKIVVKPGRK